MAPPLRPLASPKSTRDSSLLSAKKYDNDASSLHSDQEHDSEDDEVLMGARSSADIRNHDQGVLLEEEEREEMIRRTGLKRMTSFNRSLPPLDAVRNVFEKIVRRGSDAGSTVEARNGNAQEKRNKRKERRRKKKERLHGEAEHGEDGHLMYEMEEGGLKEGSSTGESSGTEGSSEVDRRLLHQMGDNKKTQQRRWKLWLFVHILIGLLFAILVLGAWRLSMNRKPNPPEQKMLSNGTALFAPTTILISLDGFRADFLQRGITPRLNALIAEGVSPNYMLPSFPSVTFPNHYTLVTGLYPEAHGVVGNTFWDPIMKQEFFYTDPARSMQGKWWGGEPLWVTAEKHGIRTAIHMWPGSEAHIMEVEPTFLDKYNGKEMLSSKVDRVLGLIDRPGMEAGDGFPISDMRPQLIAAYVPNVDADGHKFGPNSTEIRTTINEVDLMLDHLFAGLEARNLTDIVNIVVVSDHGMATTSTDRLIQLDDIIDMNQIERVDGWPLYGLRPTNPAHLQTLYDTLTAEAASNPGFEVYLRDVNMPERWHFSKNERIAPLWIIPETGWAIVTKEEFNVEEEKAKGGVFHPRGLHGYDHEHPLMRAIFIARGPAFPHAPNSRVDAFQNIEVYNIVCDSLGLEPQPNNGTLRLPFKPVGLHSPSTTSVSPVDLPATPSEDAVATTDPDLSNIISISPIEASSAADPNLTPPHLVGVNPPEEDPAAGGEDVPDGDKLASQDETAESKEAEDSGNEIKAGKTWWDKVLEEFAGLKTWAEDLVHGE